VQDKGRVSEDTWLSKTSSSNRTEKTQKTGRNNKIKYTISRYRTQMSEKLCSH
jgi:hypothetical protein